MSTVTERDEWPRHLTVEELERIVGEANTLLDVQKEARISRTQARALIRVHFDDPDLGGLYHG